MFYEATIHDSRRYPEAPRSTIHAAHRHGPPAARRRPALKRIVQRTVGAPGVRDAAMTPER